MLWLMGSVRIFRGIFSLRKVFLKFFSLDHLIHFLAHLVVFLSGFGLAFPYKQFYLIEGLNPFVFVYIPLVIILLLTRKKIVLPSSYPKSLFFLGILIAFSMIISTFSFFFIEVQINSIIIIFRQILFSSIFIFFPYLILRYGISPQGLILTWIVSVTIENVIYYYMELHNSTGGLIYLEGENTLGFYISLVSVWNFYFIFRKYVEKRFFLLLIFSLLLIFNVSALLFTWSKGSWLSFLICFLIIFLFSFRSFPLFNLFILSVALFIIYLNLDMIIHLISTEISASQGSRSNEARYTAALAGIKMWLYTFGFGVGPKNYPTGVVYYDIPVTWVHPDPHNAYAHILAEYGTIAFISFIAMLIILFKIRTGDRLFDFFFKVSIISILINSLFTGETITQNFFYLLSSIYLGNFLRLRAIHSNSSSFVDFKK